MMQWKIWPMVLAGAMWPGAAVLAQDSGEPTVSWFSMFFLSGDAIGLLIIWVLLLASALCIGFAIKLLMQFRSDTLLPDKTRRELKALIDQGDEKQAQLRAQRDPSYLGQLVHAALTEAPNGYAAMERAIEEAADVETTRYLRPVEYLNVAGNIAPMLGLFGTVYGMIVAFQDLVAAGGHPKPAELAAGISTALVTTFWGLVVAIPALASYALIRNRIDALTSEGTLMVEQMIARFKPAGQRGEGTTEPSLSKVGK